MVSATDPVEVWRTAARSRSAYTSRLDWDQAVKVWEGLGDVQPDRSYESYTPSRDISQERRIVFLPITADVTEQDRLLIEGQFFEVDGRPERHTKTSRRHIRLIAWRSLR
ncbi:MULTISPECIES: hypothetical protein [Streptomyces]|uniref:Head-tail adaptor protein n=2 Tax=Streptomyces TaxID=1883 RepID=A0ABV9IST1_9ACTN